jgi:hypothetical protein
LDLPLIRGCAWPFISDVQTLNAFYPDTNATYWIAPYIALPGSQLIVQGTYPNARFMSLNTYDRLGSSVGALYDAAIAPDAGSTNPFVDPASGPGGRFTVTITPPQDLAPYPPRQHHPWAAARASQPSPGGARLCRLSRVRPH